ncbi:hypothetical protein [Streptomyces sp. NPDC093990]|uniref:hypothetical protein n=1 Tax=Streptomyces sp. NPDC093990 TaxID=3155306 RepID=UPI0034335000
MTETRISSTGDITTDSPIALLFDIVRETTTESEDEQRENALLAAVNHAWHAYSDTLAQVLPEEAWTGQARLAGAGLNPCAVAYLGDGLWLHHSSPDDREEHTLTLIAPCTCGHGYVDALLSGESDLLELLAELRATQGRFPHNDKRPDCASQNRVRDWDDVRC